MYVTESWMLIKADMKSETEDFDLWISRKTDKDQKQTRSQMMTFWIG